MIKKLKKVPWTKRCEYQSIFIPGTKRYELRVTGGHPTPGIVLASDLTSISALMKRSEYLIFNHPEHVYSIVAVFEDGTYSSLAELKTENGERLMFVRDERMGSLFDGLKTYSCAL